MANQGKLGIGNLQSLQQTSDDSEEEPSSEETPEKTAEEDESVPAGTQEDSSVPEEPQANQEPQDDWPIGEESGTMVYDQSNPRKQQVRINCHAHSCIFNRQGNCHAQEVEIDMSSQKGQVPDATSCKTYQPANPNGD